MKKIHSHNSGTGKEWKNPFPQFRNGKRMKKTIPIIREREWNEKIHSHNSGTGIRGFHSWEWTGTGIPAHPCSCSIAMMGFEWRPSVENVLRCISTSGHSGNTVSPSHPFLESCFLSNMFWYFILDVLITCNTTTNNIKNQISLQNWPRPSVPVFRRHQLQWKQVDC